MNSNSALTHAIELTDQILKLLDDGKLEQVGELEIQRKIVIEQAFMGPVERIDLTSAQQLRNLNQKIVEKLTLSKQSIVLQQVHIQTGFKANRAYLDIESGHN